MKPKKPRLKNICFLVDYWYIKGYRYNTLIYRIEIFRYISYFAYLWNKSNIMDEFKQNAVKKNYWIWGIKLLSKTSYKQIQICDAAIKFTQDTLRKNTD